MNTTQDTSGTPVSRGTRSNRGGRGRGGQGSGRSNRSRKKKGNTDKSQTQPPAQNTALYIAENNPRQQTEEQRMENEGSRHDEEPVPRIQRNQDEELPHGDSTHHEQDESFVPPTPPPSQELRTRENIDLDLTVDDHQPQTRPVRAQKTNTIRILSDNGSGKRNDSLSVNTGIPEEDPGIVNLINEISHVIETTTEPHDLALSLLISSDYWSENSIKGISNLRAPYLVVLLQKAGIIETGKGNTTAKQHLLNLHTKLKSDTAHIDPMKATTKIPNTRSSGREPHRKRPKIVRVDTGRRDHRGYPIYEYGQYDTDEEDTSNDPNQGGNNRGNPEQNKPSSCCPDNDEEDPSSLNMPIERDPGPEMGDSGTDRSESGPTLFRDRNNHSIPTRMTMPEDKQDFSALKLALQFVSRPENKWSGPRDQYYTTEEYIRHFDYTMRLFNISSRNRVRMLPLTLKSDALDEFYKLEKDSKTLKKVTNASAIIRIISKTLETPEFMIMHKNMWTSMTMASVRREGDDLQSTFTRLKKQAERLQKILGESYSSDSQLCDFFRRSLQDEKFWAYVSDFDDNQSAELLCGKIRNAIEKQLRLDRNHTNSVTMSHAMENRRWGKPNRKRVKKNPSRNGEIMLCTGCGADDHFYRECNSPNKSTYRENKLKQIAEMKSKRQKRFLKSYFTQLESEEDDTGANGDPEESTDVDSENSDNFDAVADELAEALDETMFVEEVSEDHEAGEEILDECLETSTRHAIFGGATPIHGRRKILKKLRRKPRETSKRYPASRFPGIMIDNGSTGSLCSLSQLKAYRQFTGNPTPLRRIKNHYVVSAHGGSNCIGMATFTFPYLNSVIKFDAPIVENIDAPLILGLKEQDRMRSRGADQRDNTISFFDGPKISLKRENGHLWLRWNFKDECLYTEDELTKIHYRFGHASVQRIHDAIKRAEPKQITPETRKMLKDIQERCKECQYMAPKPYIMKLSVPYEDVVFNSEVVIDIMYIQGAPVLHVVDRATHFQAARFLNVVSSKEIWQKFMEMWVLAYLGAPDNIRHDQGSQFKGAEFQAMAAESGIRTRPIGFEAANAMGVGERYHGPLRRTFLKLQSSYNLKPLSKMTKIPAIGPSDRPLRERWTKKMLPRKVESDDKFLLAASVMAINATVGPEGICPVLLVFGAMPKIPLPGSSPAAAPLGERLMMIEKAREEYLKIISTMRLKQAEKGFVPKRPSLELQHGDKVLVYRDTSGRWEPRTFLNRTEHVINVYEPNGKIQPYSISRVSEFKEGTYMPRPDLYGILPLDVHDQHKTGIHPGTSDRTRENTVKDPPARVIAPASAATPSRENINSRRRSPRLRPWQTEEQPMGTELDDDEIPETDPIISELSTHMETHCSTHFQEMPLLETNYTKVLKNNESHMSSFKDAIDTELNGLLDRGTFKEVKRSSFSTEELRKMTIIRAKLLLSIKEPGQPEEKKKARIVAQAIGSKDRDKHMLMTYSPTVSRGSIRLMLSIAGNRGDDIFIRDISQAYVSSDSKLLRKVYLIPPRELQLDSDILWFVERPLYGLPESGVCWYNTYSGHHRDVLNMKSTATDPCFLYRHNKNEDLDGMVCLQVDDSIGSGSSEFLEQEEKESKIFNSKGQTILKENQDTKFNGQHIMRHGNIISVHQVSYCDRMPETKIERSPESFMSHRGQAAYVSTCTRPDITCAINQLSQIKATEATEEDFKKLDNIFKKAKNENLKLKYGNVDLQSAEIHVFTDASFANNKDLSSQLGYVILIVDETGNCSILSWSSTKCKRVTRSVLAAELYALAHGFDAGFAMCNTMRALLGRKVPIRVFTDSRTLFDSVTSVCNMSEKRLLIDIYALREAHKSGDLANIGWIRTKHNLADALTKDMSNSALHSVIKTHRIKTPVEQWVDKGPIHQE